MSHADAHAALLARNDDTVEQFCIELRAKRRKVKNLSKQLQTERNDNEQLRDEVKRANDQTKYYQRLMTDADKKVEYLLERIKEKRKQVKLLFKQSKEEWDDRLEAERKVKELQAKLDAANLAKSRKNAKGSHPYYMRFKEAQRKKAIARAEEQWFDDYLRRQAIAQEAEQKQVNTNNCSRGRALIFYLEIYVGRRVQQKGAPLQIYDDNVDVSDDAFKDTLNQAASLLFGDSAPTFSDGYHIMEHVEANMIAGVVHNPVTKKWRLHRAGIATSPCMYNILNTTTSGGARPATAAV